MPRVIKVILGDRLMWQIVTNPGPVWSNSVAPHRAKALSLHHAVTKDRKNENFVHPQENFLQTRGQTYIYTSHNERLKATNTIKNNN